MTIEYKPRNIRHLAGVVTDVSGAVIPGAVIADCDATYRRVLASTKTDSNGRFNFEHVSLGSRHYLKVDYPNSDEVHMPVKIWPFAGASLHIQLHVGT